MRSDSLCPALLALATGALFLGVSGFLPGVNALEAAPRDQAPAGQVTLAGKPAGKAVADFTGQPDLGGGDPILAWFARQAPRWEVEFGTPSFFFVKGGAMHLVARPGPKAAAWNPLTLMKREDKIIVRITAPDFRQPVGTDTRLEFTMAPLRLPGKGADLTDSDRNDACFYLLIGFDGPLHSYQGSKLPDSIAYVWADGAWKSGATVGKDPDYEQFMRYLAIGRGQNGVGAFHTFSRDVAKDFRQVYPERASSPVPAITRVGLMVDSNTVKSEAESALKSIRFLP